MGLGFGLGLGFGFGQALKLPCIARELCDYGQLKHAGGITAYMWTKFTGPLETLPHGSFDTHSGQVIPKSGSSRLEIKHVDFRFV